MFRLGHLPSPPDQWGPLLGFPGPLRMAQSCIVSVSSLLYLFPSMLYLMPTGVQAAAHVLGPVVATGLPGGQCAGGQASEQEGGGHATRQPQQVHHAQCAQCAQRDVEIPGRSLVGQCTCIVIGSPFGMAGLVFVARRRGQSGSGVMCNERERLYRLSHSWHRDLQQ